MAALIVATVLLAAAHASTQEPVRVGGAIQAPRKIRDVQPFYPEGARSKGVVVLQCIIGSDGRVTRADVVQSIPELDRAAVDAVLQWEYEPTVVNGVAVPVYMTATVNFAPCFFESEVIAGYSPAEAARLGTVFLQKGGLEAFSKEWRAAPKVEIPRKTHDVEPVYPDMARMARVRGNVYLEVTLETDGSLSNLRVVRGVPLLDPAATAAVRQWTFEPYRPGGVPERLHLLVGVSFCDVLP